MKWARLLLTIPVLLLTAVFGYLYWGAQAEISVNVETAPAAEHIATYETVAAAIENGTAAEIYNAQALASAEDCTLVSVKVSMRNPGALPMEWVTCAFTPRSGDIALYAIEGLPEDISSEETIHFELQLIRLTDSVMDYPNLTVTYYVAGQELTHVIGG